MLGRAGSFHCPCVKETDTDNYELATIRAKLAQLTKPASAVIRQYSGSIILDLTLSAHARVGFLKNVKSYVRVL